MSEPNWKDIALYLADCHAATGYREGSLKSGSKSEKERHLSICREASALIKGEKSPKYHYEDENPGWGRSSTGSIVERLDETADFIEGVLGGGNKQD